MVSFNGNTVRTSCLKRNDSVIISGMRVHHNFIRPQQGMNGDTPADMEGLRVRGNDKTKTIIQNATISDWF